MSKFGKTLVFLHVGLSFILLGASIAIFTNQIRWNTPKQVSGGERVEGLVSQKQKKFQNLFNKNLAFAAKRFQLQRGKVSQQEALINADGQYYAAEIQHLRTDAARGKAARGVQRVDGQFVPDPRNNGRPTMVLLQDSKGDPLLSLQHYRDQIADEETKYQEASDKLDLAARDDKKATDQLTGPKGLHQLGQDELAKQDRLKQEKKDVRPLYINRAVELELLRNLKKRLVAREKELEEAIATRKAGQ